MKKIENHWDRVHGKTAVTNASYKNYDQDNKANSQWIYGLELAEDQLDPT